MPTTMPHSVSAPTDEQTSACPGCGLTATELLHQGRMGCATCYTTFEAMVQHAAVELHGYGGAGRPRPSPTLPTDRLGGRRTE